MAVLQEKEVCSLNSFGVSRLTKNHQYKIRLLTQTSSQVLI